MLTIIEQKLRAASSQAGFLLYTRNPIKICVLFVDLLKKKYLKLRSPMRFKTERLITQAISLAT